MKITNISLTPNAQGKIQVPIPPQSDYALLYGKIVAPYSRTLPDGQVASGSQDLACRFNGAGSDPSGTYVFFDPPTGPVPPGPYDCVVGTVQ